MFILTGSLLYSDKPLTGFILSFVFDMFLSNSSFAYFTPMFRVLIPDDSVHVPIFNVFIPEFICIDPLYSIFEPLYNEWIPDDSSFEPLYNVFNPLFRFPMFCDNCDNDSIDVAFAFSLA